MEDTGDLAKILLEDLRAKAQIARERRRLEPAARDALILELCTMAPLSVRELSQLLDRTDAYIGDAIRPLIEVGRLTYTHPDQPRHPRQRYVVPGSPAAAFAARLPSSAANQDEAPSTDKAVEELAAKEAKASLVWSDLEQAAMVARERKRLTPEFRDDLVVRLCSIAPLSARELATLMQRSEAYISDAIQPLVRSGRLTFLYPDQPRHPRQKYIGAEPPDAAGPELEIKRDGAEVGGQLPLSLPQPSPLTAQERWSELEEAARPARENRYLGGVEFAELLAALAGIAPVSAREVAILTDRREEYIRQVLEDMVTANRVRATVDESQGTRRTKYHAADPSRFAPPARHPMPPPAPPAAAQTSARTSAPAPTPTAMATPAPLPVRAPAGPATPAPPGAPGAETPPPPPAAGRIERPATADRPVPAERVSAAARKPVTSASIPDKPTAAPEQAEGDPSIAAPRSRTLLTPLTSLVSAVTTGLVIALADPRTWPVWALLAALTLATLHVSTDSAQYRRYRTLNPRRDRKFSFWVLKLLVSLTEILVVYALVSSF